MNHRLGGVMRVQTKHHIEAVDELAEFLNFNL